MSFQAISWVLSQDISKSTDKFVLLCMANYADETGYCYPSVERLCKDTSQDRKTVMRCLASLKESGLLTDTGRRVGSTKSVPIYRIDGLPEASHYHYVYKLTDPDTGRYYYGKRSCQCAPAMDTYRGSGKWPKAMASEGVFLIREIIGEYETAPEALAAEMVILRSIGDDKLSMNSERPYANRQQALDRKQYQVSQAVPNFPTEQYQISLISSPKNGTQNLSSKPINEPNARAKGDFDEWYSLYPNKVGKADAAKAFLSARKQASLEELMDGLRRYVAKKDDRMWCNPATWLRQARWLDQPATGSKAPTQQVDWQRRMDYYHEKNTWSPAWGPAPGEIGCKAPQQYLNGSLPMGISTRQGLITTSDSSGYQSQT